MFLSNILYQLKTDVLQFQNEVNTTRHWAAVTMPYMAEKQMQQSVCMLNMPLCVCLLSCTTFVMEQKRCLCFTRKKQYMGKGVAIESHERKRERERETLLTPLNS